MKTKRDGYRKNRKGKIQRFKCLSCGKKFSLKRVNKFELTRRHLEDKSSYGDIKRRDKVSKVTAIKAVHEVSASVKNSFFVARHFKPKWSGILCFDGTYLVVKNCFAELERSWINDEAGNFLHKMVALLGTDFHTRDLPHYSLGDNENMIDLVMYFKQLRENGYELKVLVRDGNEGITTAAKLAYERPIVTQLCHKHFLDKMDEKINCKELLKERDKIIELKGRIVHIIKAPDIEPAIVRMSEFVREQNKFRTSQTMNYLVDRFLRDFEELTMYLQYPKGLVPTTANLAECINNQLKARIKSIRGFQSIKSAENYLKMWCLKRRFQKFTDCKKPYTHLNGKAPLEIACCKIKNIDYLSL